MNAFSRDFHRYRAHRPGESAIKVLLTEQGLWALLQYRTASWVYRSPMLPFLKSLALVFLAIWQKLVEIVTGFCLPYTARIGPGLYLPHFGRVILNNETVIGQDCDILPGVVIGVAGRGAQRGVPVIGDRVHISANAVVVGKIHVGHDVMVGANSLISANVPSYATVVGVPAQIINMYGSMDYLIDVAPSSPEEQALCDTPLPASAAFSHSASE